MDNIVVNVVACLREDFQQNMMTGKNDGDAHRIHSYDDLGFFQVSDCKGSIKLSVYGLATYSSPSISNKVIDVSFCTLHCPKMCLLVLT